MFCISCTLLSDAIYKYIYECALHDQMRIDHAQSSHMQRHDASGTDSLRTNYPIHTLDFEFHTTVRLFCSTQGHQLWHHQPTPTQPAHRAPSWNVYMNVTDNTWHITVSVKAESYTKRRSHTPVLTSIHTPAPTHTRFSNCKFNSVLGVWFFCVPFLFPFLWTRTRGMQEELRLHKKDDREHNIAIAHS